MSPATTRLDRHRWAIPVVLLAVVPLVFFQAGQSYGARIFTLFLMYAVLTVSMNIVFGHTDQLLLFVGGVTGIGAYTTLLTAEALGVSLWATVIPGALLAGAFGTVTCFVAARRRMGVIVISILTIALQLALTLTYTGLSGITGGDTGKIVPESGIEPVLSGLGIPKLTFLFYAFLLLLALVLFLYQYLMNSEYGLAFDVIRQDEIAAQATGVAVVRYKSLAGFISTFIFGLVGPLYMQVEGFVFPGMFTFGTIDILVLIILIVGGIRTLYGPVVGAAIMVYVNERLQSAQQFRGMIFGLLLIFLFLYFRKGIVPYADRLLEERFDYKRRLSELG